MSWKDEIRKREPAISPDYMRELGDIADFLVKTLDETLTEERVAPFPEEDKGNFKKLTKLLDEALEIVYELKDGQEGRGFIRTMTRTTQRKSPRMGVEGGTKGRGSKRHGKGDTFRGQ